ncbi:PREDICTED: uncharacterized protein LOC106099515 [Papilio polytes]|uniref:uncharacterized protein LOC106099515 n=1 Tax=Papilio polytes TaxID=76194 RepID=UPI0006765409|nr:PREDICTED: uncharacterized protein LOC106099515 [Papilio polytes]
MKTDPESRSESENLGPAVTGDVIGDTAYSERFVLKILLKLANLDSLKDELNEKVFEDDICTLWDMTVERDVVLFLLKHKVLNLFNFALPTVETPRYIEIFVGIIGNMCCQKEAVQTLIKMDEFLYLLLDYIKTDDSLILIQLLRLVSSALSSVDSEDIVIWLSMFVKVNYSDALYYILKNSSNKQLLMTALENLNTICSYCNIQKFRNQYFEHFIHKEVLTSLTTAFTELTVTQKESLSKDELERIMVISLQMTLDMVSFETPTELFDDCKENVATIISTVLEYYEAKLVQDKEIDSDLVDLLECINNIIGIIPINEECEPEKYFNTCYSMWKALKSITKVNQNGDSNFEEIDKEEFQEFVTNMKPSLSMIMCKYMQQCPRAHLFNILDKIGDDNKDILMSLTDGDLKLAVSNRILDYTTRLNDLDS